nr:MAG TPA: tail protein [Caudoviricetes sp.]
MHSVSDLWRTLLASPGHRKEVKLVIAGVTYGEDKIVDGSLRIDGGLYSTFGIGNCCARQIDFEIYPQGTIPRQAKIEVYMRLRLVEQVSEWIPKGVFFFSTRKTDRITSVLSVHGYDAMLKAEQTWIDGSYDGKEWPMPALTVVNDIAKRMGVSVDSRTELNAAFPVQYPVDSEGDMTMREALSRVAVANAGNWTITDEGKLLLVGLNSMPAETHYLITETGSAITFGGVRILV